MKRKTGIPKWVAVAVYLLLLLVAVAMMAPQSASAAPQARSVTVKVPQGATLHVYPEAGQRVEAVQWRCTTRRSAWKAAIDGGWKPGCSSVKLSAPFFFDFEVGKVTGQQAYAVHGPG